VILYISKIKFHSSTALTQTQGPLYISIGQEAGYSSDPVVLVRPVGNRIGHIADD
jgi:hypothetical protein